MDGFSLAQTITKKNAKTFYFASRFLSKEKRKAAYAVYAICRASDETVDGQPASSSRKDLDILRKKITSAYQDTPAAEPLLLSFQQTINRYHIPQRYFDLLLEGMEMDLTKNRYQNFKELYDYCYKVAGVVGLIMLDIFGKTGPETADHAVDLGVAMQLTNILRDIKEDFNMGRIYLPQDEMRSFGVSEDDISRSRLTGEFKAFLRSQVSKAREYYEKAKPGIKMIRDQRSRLVIHAMADIYAGILNTIEKNNYNIFAGRACVSTPGKINILSKIIFRGEYL